MATDAVSSGLDVFKGEGSKCPALKYSKVWYFGMMDTPSNKIGEWAMGNSGGGSVAVASAANTLAIGRNAIQFVGGGGATNYAAIALEHAGVILTSTGKNLVMRGSIYLTDASNQEFFIGVADTAAPTGGAATSIIADIPNNAPVHIALKKLTGTTSLVLSVSDGAAPATADTVTCAFTALTNNVWYDWELTAVRTGADAGTVSLLWGTSLAGGGTYQESASITSTAKFPDSKVMRPVMGFRPGSAAVNQYMFSSYYAIKEDL